jgi:enoyl-[acyl-carrier-protein] reductase (NADH)
VLVDLFFGVKRILGLNVGNATAALATEAGRLITGETIYVDGGYHIID